MFDFVTYLGCPPQAIGLIVATALLLCVSAMVSGAEAAYFSLSPANLRDIKQRGTLSADGVIKLLKDPDTLLATILVVNNLVNICIVVLSSKAIDLMLHFERFEFLFTGVFVTFLLLLFGEILPKIFAQGSNVRVALTLSQPLLLLRWVFYPMSYVLIRTSSLIGEKASHYSDISIEELADAVDMTTASSSEEQKMLSGIVTFANRDGGFYYARVVNQIPFEKILRGNPHRSFAVNFRCKPFWYEADVPVKNIQPGSGSTSGYVTMQNPGNVPSEPIITVTGSGEITLIVDMTIVELSDVNGEITIDSVLQEAYSGITSMNSCMSGDFPTLPPGNSTISWTGNVTYLKVEPNWRYL